MRYLIPLNEILHLKETFQSSSYRNRQFLFAKTYFLDNAPSKLQLSFCLT